MRKIIFYLLLLISTVSFGQTTIANKLKITAAIKDNLASRVMVQDSLTGELKWVLKNSLGTVKSVTGTSGVTVALGTSTPVIGLGAITPTSTNGVSATTMAYNDATSSIQTQLNGKQPVGTYATGTGSATGTNTGDNAVNTLYSGLVTNATHTGDAIGATALTVKGINGTLLSGLATGILKNTTTTGVPTIATVRTDYAEPTTALGTGILKNTTTTGAHTIAVAADFPTLNQNTTGNAATVTTNANLTGVVTSVGNATAIADGAIALAKLAPTTAGFIPVGAVTTGIPTYVAMSGDVTIGSTGVTAIGASKVTNAMLVNGAVANLSGTNSGNQTIASTSDATSHTATLSATGGSLKLVEGSNITLTTSGTGADGIVTIASTAGGSGTVTSVAALTLGTTGTDLSSTVATGTTTPIITLNVPTASASNRGALSSADWSTFNSKQNALTNPITGTGTSGYVSFWNGTNTQSADSNFFWDNTNKRLGIGPTSPTQKLDVNGNIRLSASDSRAIGGDVNGRFITSNSDFTSYINFWGSSSSTAKVMELNSGDYISFNSGSSFLERMRITSGGNVLIGTTTDIDGVTKLQVSGTVKSGTVRIKETSSEPAALELTNRNSTKTFRIATDEAVVDDGNLAIIDATLGTVRASISTTGVVKITNLSGTGTRTVVADASGNLSASATSNPNYKVYTALVSQSGTSAPTATVLENTLGGTVVWSRVAAGFYNATLTGVFTSNKTTVLVTQGNGQGLFSSYGDASTNYVNLNNFTFAGTQTDNILNNTSIEIRVYN